ncbi:MAG: hypothetical protein WA364_00055 [Candidatus Nitrosopolaris sp.]
MDATKMNFTQPIILTNSSGFGGAGIVFEVAGGALAFMNVINGTGYLFIYFYKLLRTGERLLACTSTVL